MIKRYFGNIEKAKRLHGLGIQLMAVVRQQIGLSGLKQKALRHELSDGSIIEAKSMFGQENLNIFGAPTLVVPSIPGIAELVLEEEVVVLPSKIGISYHTFDFVGWNYQLAFAESNRPFDGWTLYHTGIDSGWSGTPTAYDEEGVPHILYDNTGLGENSTFASLDRDTGLWTYSGDWIINAPTRVVRKRFQIDQAGNFHVTGSNAATKIFYYGYKLQGAPLVPGSFEDRSFLVDAGAGDGARINDTAVTAKGVLHTVHHKTAGANINLMHGVYDGGWMTELIQANVGQKACAIALDKFDVPHIVWNDQDTPALYYSYKTGGAFTVPEVISAVVAGNHLAIDLDSNGKAYVSWRYSVPPLTQMLSTNASGAWVNSVIEANADAASGGVHDTDMKLDPLDNYKAHSAYIVKAPGDERVHYAENLDWAELDSLDYDWSVHMAISPKWEV